MGADFLLYSLPWAPLDDARQKQLHDTIDQLSDDELREVADAVGIFDEVDLPAVRRVIHTAIGEYVALERRRDTTLWRHGVDPITRIYTGGLSWGDGPTDCCQTFDTIATCPPICELLEHWALGDARSDAAATRTPGRDNVLQAVLTEFCKDVEAVGREQVAKEWPDLVVTYDRAKAALPGVRTPVSRRLPGIAGIMACLCEALTDNAHGIEGCVIESSDNDNKDGEIFIAVPTGDGETDSFLIKIAPH